MTNAKTESESLTDAQAHTALGARGYREAYDAGYRAARDAAPTPAEPAAPVLTSEHGPGALEGAYWQGWCEAAAWAKRDDLYADRDSQAYVDAMNRRLGPIRGFPSKSQREEFPGDLCLRCYGSGKDPTRDSTKPEPASAPSEGVKPVAWRTPSWGYGSWAYFDYDDKPETVPESKLEALYLAPPSPTLQSKGVTDAEIEKVFAAFTDIRYNEEAWVQVGRQILSLAASGNG